MKRLILAGLIALGTAPLAAQPCWACSCVPYDSPREERHAHAKHADVVFTGKTKRVEVKPDQGRIIAYFRVEKAYKGTHRDNLVIKTASSGAACGFYFKDDTRYTVFGFGDGPRVYQTNSCSGTKQGRIDPDRYGL
jgi:hypothetical protein